MPNEVKPHLLVRGRRLDRLRKLLWERTREKSYKTKKDFAKYLGCNDTSTYRRWVYGMADMADYAAKKLVDHHGLTIDFLKHGTLRNLPNWVYDAFKDQDGTLEEQA